MLFSFQVIKTIIKERKREREREREREKRQISFNRKCRSFVVNSVKQTYLRSSSSLLDHAAN